MAETKLEFMILATDKASQKFRDVGNEMNRTHDVMGKFAAVGVGAFAVVGAAAVAFGIEALRAGAAGEQAGRLMTQIATNSGAFGQTTEEIKKTTDGLREYAKGLSNVSGVSKDTLEQILSGWMAVPQMAAKGSTGLEKMLGVVADVAAGTGKDVSAIGLAFTKVSGDAEGAMSKLLRAGIVFSQDQKNTYQRILDTNGEISAQDYLVGLLGDRYKGAAEAAASPWAVLAANVTNLQEELGTYLQPALKTFVDKIREFIETHGPKLKDVFEKAGVFLGNMVDAFFAFSDWVDNNPDIWTDIVAGLAIVTGAVWALDAALDANPVGAVMALIAGLIAFTVGVVVNWNQIIGGMVGGFQILFGGLLGLMEGFVNSFIDGINLAINAVNTLGANIANIPKADFGADSMIHQGIETQRNAGMHGGSTVTGAPSSSHAQRGMRAMAAGGIVSSATRALVGEAGPEAVIPLSKLDGMFGGGSPINVSVTVNAGAVADRDALSKSVTTAIVDGVKRGIVSRSELRRSLGIA